MIGYTIHTFTQETNWNLSCSASQNLNPNYRSFLQISCYDIFLNLRSPVSSTIFRPFCQPEPDEPGKYKWVPMEEVDVNWHVIEEPEEVLEEEESSVFDDSEPGEEGTASNGDTAGKNR